MIHQEIMHIIIEETDGEAITHIIREGQDQPEDLITVTEERRIIEDPLTDPEGETQEKII